MKKILAIEDEKDLLQLLKYNLEQSGYQALLAQDGEKGLSLVRKKKPDLIILDLMLPDMDGFEFCRIVRQENDTPIIFLSGAKSDLCRNLCRKLGGNDYITKPFSIDQLLVRIKDIFSGELAFPR